MFFSLRAVRNAERLLKNFKRKKERPTHWQTLVSNGEKEETVFTEVGKLPRTYVVVEMPPPGLLTDAPLSDSNPETQGSSER